MNRPLALIAALIVVVGTFALMPSNRASETLAPIGAAVAQDSEVDTSMVEEMSMGNPDAKVTVIEYASFTCPHCRNFHASVLKDLKRDYIDTGKINFIYREVYFDRYGLWAGMIARCGGPLRYFGITDLIYEQQQEWTKGGEPAAIAASLRKIGKTAGLSDEELDQCMGDGKMAQALVAAYQENAKADEITATPSFVINGEKYSNMSYDQFKEILDEKLAE